MKIPKHVHKRQIKVAKWIKKLIKQKPDPEADKNWKEFEEELKNDRIKINSE